MRLRQRDLANRMRAQGFHWYGQTVSELEQGKRVIRADEMLGLAIALESTVPALMAPPPVAAAIVLPSGELVAASRVTEIGSDATWDGDRLKITSPAGPTSALDALLAGKRDELRRLEELRQELDQAPWPGDSQEGGKEQPVVAAAIVTSPLGALVARRRDGSPLWTFIAGEIEPGERPEDTIVREVKEETTLWIRAGQFIGQQIHPRTHRTMVYIAATPTHGTDVALGDSEAWPRCGGSAWPRLSSCCKGCMSRYASTWPASSATQLAAGHEETIRRRETNWARSRQ
jgi:ADP-ribose pyrophosphatase YjhB (NUDIX family)